MIMNNRWMNGVNGKAIKNFPQNSSVHYKRPHAKEHKLGTEHILNILIYIFCCLMVQWLPFMIKYAKVVTERILI
jgi:hypothetical protein